MNSKTYIQDWFSQNAEKFSKNVAIDYGMGQFTYGEIETQSNKLANFLIDHGAVKGSLVAICCQDTLDVIVAVIGILKAGCVFVPLAPNLPEQRINAIIAETFLEWFIVDAIGLTIISNYTGSTSVKLQIISRENQATADVKSTFNYLGNYSGYSVSGSPNIQSEPDDMCYIYFTSGSTGKPKGIAGRLKAIAHFINWEINTLGIQELTRVSQLISPSFDAFLRDIFVPLCSGGVVCIPETVATILDGRKLVKWIDSQKINLIHCVPSLFRSLLSEDLNSQQFSSLQYILLSGEPIFGGDVARWLDVYGQRIQLVNLYGASETTMTKFFYFVKPADQERQIIPIGQPMEGAAALVVDEKGKVCSPGMVGEIYIRTPYRTLGYYQQVELTNEVFIPNPFSNNPQDIVYKTGDLGRILPEGDFEYLGRKDRQVKIRGVRIELGEIENYLRLHPAVKDGIVVDLDDEEGNKYLCAYVVLKAELESVPWRDFLRKSLPEFMVPSSLIVLDSLPRTISGKVDRRSLPKPDQSQSQTYVPPRTPVEAELALIWMQVLNLERLGVNDNFFELGGHSLLATRLVSRVGRAFNVEIPLRILFESPTVATQAESIETLRWLKESSPVAQEPVGSVLEEGEL